jgi:hypothetical protein
MRISIFFGFLISLVVTSVAAQTSLYLKIPFDGAVFSSSNNTVKFSWNHDGSNNYSLEVSDDIGFSSPSIFPAAQNSIELLTANLFTGQNYWRIVSSNGNTSLTRSLQIVDLSSLGTILYHIKADEGVIVSSGKVSQWNNQASGFFNASQGVGSLRPDYNSSSVNGKPSVSFGGATGLSTLHLTLSSFELAQPNFSAFFTLKQQSVNNALPYLLGFQGGGRIGGVHVRGTAGTYNNFGIVYDNPLVERRPNVIGNFQWATRSIVNNQIFFNNIEVSGYTGAGTDGIRFNTIGTRPDANQLNFHGELAEIIIYNNTLSSNDRQLVDNYLLTKYTKYPNLGNDINICASSATLGPINDPAYTSVVWSTGQTGVPTIEVTANGWYWVEAIAFGRTMRDSIYVDGLVPQPILNLNNDITICAGDDYTLSFTNILPVDISATWSDGTSGSSIIVDSPGAYSVTFTSLSGCAISSPVRNIDVNYFPLTQGLGPDRTMCLNSELFFDYGTTGIAPYTHLWSTGATTASIPIVNLGTELYDVAVTDAMGCVALDTVEIELLNVEGPIVAFDFDTVCVLTPNTFTDNTSVAFGDNIIEYLWIFPTDSLFGSPVEYTPSTTSPYPVELQITTDLGCTSRIRDTVTMLPQPDVFFNFGVNICKNAPINFVAGQFTPLQIVNWEWNFETSSGIPDISAGIITSYQFPEAGNFNVTLIATDINGCTDTTTQLVNVRETPNVSFTFQEVCAGGIVSFQNTSTMPAPASIITQSWTFGDGTGSSQVNPAKPYPNHGNYNVTLTVNASNGCSAQLTQPVKVHAIPQPNYTTDATCAGVVSNFLDASFVPNGSVAIVSWSFSGSDPVQGLNVGHTFTSAGSNQVVQTVTSGFGCVGSANTNVSLNSFLSADFDIQPAALLAEYPMVFNNLSVGQTSNIWIVNGGTPINDVNPEITFSANDIGQQVEVMLIVNNADCADTIVKVYTVLENRTDLAVNQVFVQNANGFYIVGAELENRGSTPITRADVFLRSPNASLMKETWTGLLEAGEKENYIFTSQISASVSKEKESENFICVEGQIVLPAQFLDQDLTNNEACKALVSSGVIVLAPYPNPIGHNFTLQIVMPEDEVITVEVVDGLGRKIQVLLNETMLTEGLNNFVVDSSSWSGGIYSIVLRSSAGMITKKVIKAK